MRKKKMNNKNRAVRWGVVAWVLLCVAAVWMRGVQWDETYEHAQVITGQVQYPDGHPLLRYCHTAYSVQTMLSVLMLKAGLGPLAICGFRNLLVLLASVLPVFLLTTLLTRRALWGHVAAMLMLAGVYLAFDGSYPLMVWPSLYSNGHIGGGMALIIVYLLLAGHIRAGFLLAGLMPMIHAGEAPPVLGIAALMAGWLWWRGEKKAALQGVVFGATGFLLTAAFFVVASSQSLPAPTSGPYYSAIDPQAVWAGYTTLHDIHRRFPPMNGQIILIGTLVLTAAAAWRERNAHRPYLWLCLYTAGIAATVWAIMAIHARMGADIPFVLIGWMPYRLINHIAPVALSVMVAKLVNRGTPVALVGALVFLILTPVYTRIDGDMARRYLTDGQLVMFVLYGAAIGSLFMSIRPKLIWAALLLPVALAPFHQFGAACLIFGFIVAFALHRLPPPRVPRYALIGLMILMGVALLIPQWYKRQHLSSDAFSQQVAEYLETRGQSDGLLVYPPDAFLPQARTGHPILAENATPSLISYAPKIGPSIEKIYNEIYGISFRLPSGERVSQPAKGGQECPPSEVAPSWETVWAQRTPEQWRALGTEYGFNYVVGPANLKLTPVVAGQNLYLYDLGNEAAENL